MMNKIFSKTYPKILGKLISGVGWLLGEIWPPFIDDLLVWLKGDSDETSKLDAQSISDFTMSGSHCITLNGVDETGTTATNHGTISSFEGTATPSYDGATLTFTAGTFYNVTFSDGTHFRMAEGEGLTSFSDDYQTDGYSIAWTGTELNLWAGSQDTYHGNAVGGWWEINLDTVKYPYPVAGFDTYHKGGTFNSSETSLSPETSPVGTFNQVDTTIATIYLNIGGGDHDISANITPEVLYSRDIISSGIDAGDIVLQLDSTGVAKAHVFTSAGTTYVAGTTVIPLGSNYNIGQTLVGDTLSVLVNGVVENSVTLDVGTLVNNDKPLHIGSRAVSKVFNGVIRGANINGTLIPINEGAGTDIHDSEDNIVGTLSFDSTFWDGEPMVSESIIAAEQAATVYYLTDGNGHSVPKTQQEWISDGVFNVDKQRYFGDHGATIYKSPRSVEEDVVIKAYQGL